MGNVIKTMDDSRYQRIVSKAAKVYERESQRAEVLYDSKTFKVMAGTKKVLDDWFLDPLIGLIPGFGDTITTLGSLPALYFSIFTARSIKLTMAILFNTILDLIIGLFPGAGDIADAFYKSNRRSYRLCEGYVKGDEKTRREINRLALGLVVLMFVGSFGAILFYSAIIELIIWLVHLYQK